MRNMHNRNRLHNFVRRIIFTNIPMNRCFSNSSLNAQIAKKEINPHHSGESLKTEHHGGDLHNQAKASSVADQNVLPRFNPIQIQMISQNLQKQLFGHALAVDFKRVEESVHHLQHHGLWGQDTTVQPTIDFTLPKLCGNNIEEHFYELGLQQTKVYRELLDQLHNASLPPVPKMWNFSPGWTRYSRNGKMEKVHFPKEQALVFDVEVCLQDGNYPTLATAVSPDAWYSWCSARLTERSFTWSHNVTLSDLIPLETTKEERNSIASDKLLERLVVGHNVSFDRTFVKEQYFLDQTKLRFLDTLSLHMCISGLTSFQRALSVAHKTQTSKTKTTGSKKNGEADSPPPEMWLSVSSLNNLVDVYSLYCEGEPPKKELRDLFVTGTIEDIRKDFQNLMTYCASDVKATHEILQELVPLFFERFPHPVSFAGTLEMSLAYLPTNSNWERYLRDAASTYEDLQQELKVSLMHLANDACQLLEGKQYEQDPWLWDLDWSVQRLKTKQKAIKQPGKGKKRQQPTPVSEVSDENADEENAESQSIPASVENVLKTSSMLHKVRPLLPGYPAWYRDLCTRPESSDDPEWEPGPSNISTQMRVVSKLMRLLWDGYPLYYHPKHGWGYLIPGRPIDSTKEVDQAFQKFPLEEVIKICPPSPPAHELDKPKEKAPVAIDVDEIWQKINDVVGDPVEQARLWKLLGQADKVVAEDKAAKPATDGPSFHHGNGPYNDVEISGCWFYRLPHKDGPQNRVGNPLSKDFLIKVEDGTLRAYGSQQANHALRLSKMLSYWKNNHKRICSQMVVWLNRDELPDAVVRSTDYDPEGKYGAILPRVITAGTVTRRAVEPTWLTASNAYVDRIGSELKSMIQAPPGYNFVGADVDSQELWIAGILGDSHFMGMHGCTAFGWMTLQGKKSSGTDMHSKTAKSVGISRDQAKVLNYGRIYGAGLPFAQRLLMKFNHWMSPEVAKEKAQKMYAETKGVKKFVWTEADQDGMKLRKKKKVWADGTESHMFNKLEEIAQSAEPATPVLGCRISRALEPSTVANHFMTSRVNWVVQSSAVDYLHLMLTSMRWLMDTYDIKGRFSISIHDEVRYLVKGEDRYRAALALQITNLLTRSLFAYKLGMNDLPQSVAFFSSVDIDTVLRKEVNMDCKTPSNPHGLEQGYGIPPGEACDMKYILEKTNNGKLEKTDKE